MPSDIPRSNTTKKREQLTQRKQQLRHAVRLESPRDTLVLAAEKLRAAQLSLLKAELHWAQVKKIRKRDVDEHVNKINDDAQRWIELPVDQILCEYGNVPEHLRRK